MTIIRHPCVDDAPDIRDVVDISRGLDPRAGTRSCSPSQEALATAMKRKPAMILEGGGSGSVRSIRSALSRVLACIESCHQQPDWTYE